MHDSTQSDQADSSKDRNGQVRNGISTGGFPEGGPCYCKAEHPMDDNETLSEMEWIIKKNKKTKCGGWQRKEERIYKENEGMTAGDNWEEGFIVVKKEVGSVMEFNELITH
jgi:hypothetical protein